MLTFLSKGLFSAVVTLVRLSLHASKRTCIIIKPGFEEQPRHTELNGLPSVYRWLWQGPDGNNIKKNLSENSLPGYDKRMWGYLGNVWHL